MVSGAVWVKKDKNGEKYLSMQVVNPNNDKETWNMAAFKNKYKTEDKHPDFRIVFREDEPKYQPVKGQTKIEVPEEEELI